MLLRNFSSPVPIPSSIMDHALTSPIWKKDMHCIIFPPPFHARPSLDLYQQLKTCQPLLKLSRMKQPDLEAFLGMSARACCDGRECIRLYREYVQTKDSSVAEMLLGHNREDLLGLGALFSMLSYLSLYQGGYFPACAQLDQQQLILTLRLSSPVLIPVSNGNRLFYIRAENDTVRLLLPLKDGKLRQYYTNYKEYDYLPAEDTAIPKSLSTYIDKSCARLQNRIPVIPGSPAVRHF